MLNKQMAALLLALVMLFGLPLTAQAKPEFYQRIPANYEKSCNLCHVAPPILNEFGQKFKAAGFSFEKLEASVAQPTNNQPRGNGGVPAPVVQPKPVIVATALQLTVPERASRGEKLELAARLQDASGKSIAGAMISFSVPASLFIEGDMFISQALTNNDGVARIRYTPRLEGETEVKAAYGGTQGYQPAEARVQLALQGSTPVYHPDWSLKIPFVTPWLILLAVSLVWAAYAKTYAQIIAIRRLGMAEPSLEEEEVVEEEKAVAQL